MFPTAAEALSWIQAHDVDLVDMLYVDLFGGLHQLTLPRGYLSEATFVEGVGVDGSSIPGFGSLESGDRSAVPDPSSGFRYQRGQETVLAFFCDLVEADTKAPARSYPRHVARQAQAHMRSSGLATRSRWGPELEYYLFDAVELRDAPHDCGYRIHSAEAGLLSDAPGARIRPQGGYHAAPPLDRLLDLRNETVRRLEQAGVPVALHHHEVGAAGQVEIELGFGSLVETGDRIVKAKLIAKLTAAEQGMRATFMPKPLHGHAGSGLHFHQHLFAGDRPLFYAQGGYADLSPPALAYTAGLLDHSDAVLAFTNPSTNSYRRLIPGFEAPVKAFFCLANRSAAVRVPRYARRPGDKRIEFRPPDATANPYLAMSAMLMAGLDGMARQLDPAALGLGPLEANIEALPPAERAAIRSLPGSLDQALDALDADHAFLTAGEVFSPALIQAWIAHGRALGEELSRRPHPLELVRDLDC